MRRSSRASGTFEMPTAVSPFPWARPSHSSSIGTAWTCRWRGSRSARHAACKNIRGLPTEANARLKAFAEVGQNGNRSTRPSHPFAVCHSVVVKNLTARLAGSPAVKKLTILLRTMVTLRVSNLDDKSHSTRRVALDGEMRFSTWLRSRRRSLSISFARRKSRRSQVSPEPRSSTAAWRLSVFLVSTPLKSWPETTITNMVLAVASDLKINEWVAYVIAGGGVGYGLRRPNLERHDRAIVGTREGT